MRRILGLSLRGQSQSSTLSRGFRRARELSFDALCCDMGSDSLLAEQTVEGLAVEQIANEGKESRVAIILDVELDVLPAGGIPAGVAVRARYLDPRQPPAESGASLISFDDWENTRDAASRQWIKAVSERLIGLNRMGIDGFRFRNPERVPARAWRALFDALKASSGMLLAASPNRPSGFSGDNPGFTAAILPVSVANQPDIGPVVAAYGSVFGTPALPHSAGPDELLQTLRWCGGLTDGVFLPFAVEEKAFVDDTRFSSVGRLDVHGRLDADIGRLNSTLAEQNPRFEHGDFTETALASSAFRVVIRRSREDRGNWLRVIISNVTVNDRVVDLAELGPQIGEFLPLYDILTETRRPLIGSKISLKAGEVRLFEGQRSTRISAESLPAPDVAKALRAPRIAIEAIDPVVDGGRYPVKRVVGERMRVEADAFGEGHDRIAVALRWRPVDQVEWRESQMSALGNDRWAGEFPLEKTGRHVFTVCAWRDEFAIYRDHLHKKHEASAEEAVDIEEGRRLIATLVKNAEAPDRSLSEAAERLSRLADADAVHLLLAPTTAESAARASDRPFFTQAPQEYPVDAERQVANFASWYSLFPRSQSGDVSRHGTFADVEKRLPAIRKMGFDILYMTPIHPIGAKNRKGRNNTLRPEPGDPGSPYAIGSEAGGHDEIHPELGTWDDFDHLLAATRSHGMEIALDIAIQASPDHPWLKAHPEWFEWRPDGSIRYAENPPKKYEDIVNVDFYAKGAKPSLWIELRDTLLKWVRHGVKIFRVDNPHTKPFSFWEWVIADVRRVDPDVIFLSEAFTRPKVMYRLAKIGFAQSYTYFTWRSGKAEIIEYLTELAHGPAREFFRPNFFVNTHDINPDYLHNAPRSAFLIRAALATTLSGLWGIYNGFELCEGRPDAKKKEYADSEKYQLFAWDWDRPGNIIAEITALNRLRRENRALQTHLGIDFLTCHNSSILYFEKATPRRDSVVLVAISLDPHGAQEADIEVPLWKFGLPDQGAVQVEDLMRGHRFQWTGKMQHIRLDPSELPFSIWRIRRSGA